MRWTGLKHNDNSLAVRLALATGVVIHHSLAIGAGSSWDFPWVACFLVLSGFLVLGSREHSESGPHFFWKRFLRVWPPMIVGFALVFLMLGIDMGKAHFLATFFIPKPGGFFTITLEELLYLMLGALFALGFYKHRPTPWIGLVVSTGLAIYAAVRHVPGPWLYPIILVPMFFVGNILYQNRKRVSWNGYIALSCLAVSYVLYHQTLGPEPLFWSLRLLGQIALGYPVIWAALYAKPVLARLGRIGDPSYSLFLYHWPVLNLIFAKFRPGAPALFLATWTVTISMALVSWHVMESWALRHKHLVVKQSRRPAETLPLTTQALENASDVPSAP